MQPSRKQEVLEGIFWGVQNLGNHYKGNEEVKSSQSVHFWPHFSCSHLLCRFSNVQQQKTFLNEYPPHSNFLWHNCSSFTVSIHVHKQGCVHCYEHTRPRIRGCNCISWTVVVQLCRFSVAQTQPAESNVTDWSLTLRLGSGPDPHSREHNASSWYGTNEHEFSQIIISY